MGPRLLNKLLRFFFAVYGLSQITRKCTLHSRGVVWHSVIDAKDFVYTFTGWEKLYRNYPGLQKQHKKAFSQETRFILHSLQHFLWLLRLRRLLFWWHGTNDVRVTRISNAENWDTEVLATSCSQFDVVAGVMMDSSLGQHGIVLNLTFPVNRHKENYHYE